MFFGPVAPDTSASRVVRITDHTGSFDGSAAPARVVGPDGGALSAEDGYHLTVTPDEAAANLLSVIDGLTPERAGRFFNVDGQELPW